MDRPTNKAQLIKGIKDWHKKLIDKIDILPREIMLRPATVGEWSIKDMMAHVTFWEKWFLEKYQDGLAGKTIVIPDWSKAGTVDAINREAFEKNRSRDLKDIQDDFKKTYRLIIKTVENIPESDMFAAGRYDWTGKDTVAVYIIVNTSEHYAEHLAAIERMTK